MGSKDINITTKWPHQANLHHHTMHPLGQIPPATPTTSKSPTQEMASRHTTEGLWKTNSATFLKVGLANMTNKAIINSSAYPYGRPYGGGYGGGFGLPLVGGLAGGALLGGLLF